MNITKRAAKLVGNATHSRQA